ncbi:ssDNA-binding phosphoprotein [Sea otter poxvirus]|uniref:Protein OPG079 n=1 Tax=Sea otter poxvirus TaxID=1416741 RepID=A0A2U9QHL2_9POXV|nr:ssDNA-binding phosphoprotein [Sea otter poxvirus]AWU47090.1 ssDNA-binding phosphoprotein [Sea otter poxvirus]
MRKSVSSSQSRSLPNKVTNKNHTDGERTRNISPPDIISITRSLSKTTTKCISSVALTPTQYPNCFNINIALVDELATKLTSSLIMIEGEGKLYKNKSSDNFRQPNSCGYFLRIKPKSSNPLLYQLLEHIYSNLDKNVRVPPSLSGLQVSTLVEKTIKDDYLYVNKIVGAILEYVSVGEKNRQRNLMDDIELLSLRDPQVMTVLLTPLVFYKSGSECKVTFALKKLTVTKECAINVLDLEGVETKIRMSTDDDDDNIDTCRQLCIVKEPNVDIDDDDDSFNI